MGFLEWRRERQHEREARSLWNGWGQASARWDRGLTMRQVVDRSGNTIIVNGSVAFLGSKPQEGSFLRLLGQHDGQTTCAPDPGLLRVPGLRPRLAYERAARCTVDLALALSLGRLR